MTFENFEEYMNTNVSEKRFIFSDENKRDFKIPRPKKDFENDFINSISKSLITEDKLIDPKLPEYKPKHSYLKQLSRMKSYAEKNMEEEIKKATKEIKSKFEPILEFYDVAIKKLDSEIFLTEKCNMEVKQHFKK